MSQSEIVAKEKQVADFVIKTERNCEKEDRLNNLRSLMFAKNKIEKYLKERVLFKNYKERFERLLHLWHRHQQQRQRRRSVFRPNLATFLKRFYALYEFK